jgi:hypothetical protein
MMALLHVGPDGGLIGYGIIVLIALALLAWRRVRMAPAAATVVTLAVLLTIDQFFSTTETAHHPVIAASFIVVPSVVLLGASRMQWLAQRAWLLLLIGPGAFVGCYAGICEACGMAGLL